MLHLLIVASVLVSRAALPLALSSSERQPGGACWAQVQRFADRNPASYTLLNHGTCVYAARPTEPPRNDTPWPASLARSLARPSAPRRFLSRPTSLPLPVIDQSFSAHINRPREKPAARGDKCRAIKPDVLKRMR